MLITSASFCVNLFRIVEMSEEILLAIIYVFRTGKFSDINETHTISTLDDPTTSVFSLPVEKPRLVCVTEHVHRYFS